MTASPRSAIARDSAMGTRRTPSLGAAAGVACAAWSAAVAGVAFGRGEESAVGALPSCGLQAASSAAASASAAAAVGIVKRIFTKNLRKIFAAQGNALPPVAR
jgi:hypothetical protein